MFGLFKTKNNDKDVTTNPDILFDSDVPTSEIKVHGLKLNDKAELIPTDLVLTTTFEKYPADGLRYENGGTRGSWRNNKVFYQSTNGEKEYLLADRIKSVLEFGGILHMKSGAKYVIRDRTIIGIGIHGYIVEAYQKINKDSIQKQFGKTSIVKEDYEQTDGELWNTTYVYENRNIAVNFFHPDNKISHINIGQFPYSVDSPT